MKCLQIFQNVSANLPFLLCMRTAGLKLVSQTLKSVPPKQNTCKSKETDCQAFLRDLVSWTVYTVIVNQTHVLMLSHDNW